MHHFTCLEFLILFKLVTYRAIFLRVWQLCHWIFVFKTHVFIAIAVSICVDLLLFKDKLWFLSNQARFYFM